MRRAMTEWRVRGAMDGRCVCMCVEMEGKIG